MGYCPLKRLVEVRDLPGRKHFSQLAIPRLYSQSIAAQLKCADFFSATIDL